MAFINAELTHIKKPNVAMTQVLCTLEEARQKFPGAPASLDALCKRFEIDNSSRTKHGALLDAELLAEVYLELMGGRQDGLDLSHNALQQQAMLDNMPRKTYEPRLHSASNSELDAHQEFLKTLNDPLWESAN